MKKFLVIFVMVVFGLIIFFFMGCSSVEETTKSPVSPPPHAQEETIPTPEVKKIEYHSHCCCHPIFYQVKWGDTLSAIGMWYGTTVRRIMDLNPWIKNKNKIKVGWTVRVR
ncbi:MAG: LysM peptidoglycan-binding domain-containing protein [Nanoarchaeota archaeon]|nr:LysM peptidoglycan-binding domain-containing protein [Nanoarchaeota archaeon]